MAASLLCMLMTCIVSRFIFGKFIFLLQFYFNFWLNQQLNSLLNYFNLCGNLTNKNTVNLFIVRLTPPRSAVWLHCGIMIMRGRLKFLGTRRSVFRLISAIYFSLRLQYMKKVFLFSNVWKLVFNLLFLRHLVTDYRLTRPGPDPPTRCYAPPLLLARHDSSGGKWIQKLVHFRRHGVHVRPPRMERDSPVKTDGTAPFGRLLDK